MPVGSSIGDRFGPAIVVKKDSNIMDINDLAGARIATPGPLTSAFFAATAVLPNFEPVHYTFTEIDDAVTSGTCDAGILIHEPQLAMESKTLRKLDDLGVLWDRQFGLPLPLGGNAIRRSLGEAVIRQLTQIYLDSIEYALAHREVTLAKASAQAISGLPAESANRYIDQYVNHRSLRLDGDVLKGLDVLFKAGAQAGLCPPLPQSTYVC
jgi:1,4-dihydroxy-6-naphthoate synthase